MAAEAGVVSVDWEARRRQMDSVTQVDMPSGLALGMLGFACTVIGSFGFVIVRVFSRILG